MENVCLELASLMQHSSRPDIKLTAIDNVLGLTANPDGRKIIVESKKLLETIFSLTTDKYDLAVKDSYSILVNLSGDDYIAKHMVENYNLIPEFLRVVADSKSKYSDKVCGILNNFTRIPLGSKELSKVLLSPDRQNDVPNFKDLLKIYYNLDYNENKQTLHYLGPVIANLTQLSEIRDYMLDEKQNYIKSLLSFLQYSESEVRREATAATLRNCCFEYDHHMWLLGDDIDLLSHVLLPLAGPEEFDENEVDQLPIDLQYLPSDKKREPEPCIRQLLVEIITLLCADTPGREIVKSKNAYLILRELYTWETENESTETKSTEMAEACEKLIQILISDEPEKGRENLMTCEIPEKHKKYFESDETE